MDSVQGDVVRGRRYSRRKQVPVTRFSGLETGRHKFNSHTRPGAIVTSCGHRLHDMLAVPRQTTTCPYD